MTQKLKNLIRIIAYCKAALGTRYGFRAAAIILALIDLIFIYSVTGLNPLSVYGVMC